MLLTGLIGGLIPVSIGILLGMGQGIIANKALKKESPPNAPVVDKKFSSFLSAIGFLIGLIILGVGIYYIYTSQAKKVVGEPSIDERNAAASAAVSYESGADFVKALESAGVPCTNPIISPIMASGFHVADSFSCIYAKGDLVNLFVAWPSVFSSTYFSMIFEAEQEARGATGAQNLTLKGELWYAVATSDQRLFDIQETLGGQLIKPRQ